MRKNFYISTMLLMFVSALILASTSCKKDEDEPSNTDKLTGKNLTITAWTIDPGVEIGGATMTDLFAFIPDCTKDDFIVFNSDGTVTFDEGASKCEPGDPQTEQGTWMYLENETKLSVTYDGETDIMDILEITDNTLKISFEEVEDYGEGEQTYTNTITYSTN